MPKERMTLRLTQPEPVEDRDTVEFMHNGEVVQFRLKKPNEIGFGDVRLTTQMQDRLLETIAAGDFEHTTDEIMYTMSELLRIFFHDEIPPECLASLTPDRFNEIAAFVTERAEER